VSVTTATPPAAASTAPLSASAPSHRLWGGRFSRGAAAEFEALNFSIATDFRLWPHDVRASQAWAVALWNAGVLTLDESQAIERGLDRVGERLAAGEQPAPTDEDVHTMIDRMLHEEAGTVASKLHTGRSRNDQVATDTRLWTMDACTHVDSALRDLQAAIVTQAESLGDAVMPAYTHMQRAQPVLAAHWLMSHFWPLDRDRGRIAAAGRSAATLPLGSGAVAGCAFPISRVLLQGSLGFAALSRNSMDAVADRDFAVELLFALTLVGTHLSRLGEDLVLYGTSEFGFVEYDEAYSSGSSMMPQKRNPDALELARASGARAIGELTALLVTLKGLPSGYNKDLQDDKRALFTSVDALLRVLPAVTGSVATLRFRTDRMAAAISSGTLATDVADLLVRRGVPFRDAHAAVGRLVRQAEVAGVELSALSPKELGAAHPLLEDGARDAFSAQHSVGRREVDGGTGPRAVQAQIAAARASLAEKRAKQGNLPELAEG